MTNNGVFRIAAERKRQFSKHDYTLDHDTKWILGELESVASLYADLAGLQAWRESLSMEPMTPEEMANLANDQRWPHSWDKKFWKPSLDPTRNLEKAGALIAAAIDRRLEAKRRLVIKNRALGYHQEAILRRVCKEGSWFKGSWIVQDLRTTRKSLGSLVRRGLLMRGENGTYTPTAAGYAAV